MATDIDRITSLQAIADSTGLIYDRAVQPERVLGQAWLISRGRVVTLASVVTNYAEAPWALIIKFPHPNLTYAVRTVTLHPDFNRRDARDAYLSSGRGQLPPAFFENDIATLALDSDLVAAEPEKVAELNRALSVPFEISAQDMSGSMRGGEALQILQSAMSTGRSGLMTLIDQRNVPFGRISVRQTRIVRAHFEELYNELGLCELIWRKPSGNFAFQPVDNFQWPADVTEIQTPAETIMAEATRRAQELPGVIDMLGGPDVRFKKATNIADFSSINANDRWVADALWECLDGYLPLNRVAERAGTDTYTTIKMLWDFATMGLISVNQNQTFHCSGQLGPLLLPAQELDISTWDQLNAMYLDPVSGGPVSINGNFFGAAHVITNKSLIHTIPVPSSVQTAAIFKEGKLVGLHSGPAQIRATNLPAINMQRMIWIGALNELGTKRLRTTEIAADAQELAEVPVDPQVASQRLSTLRNRPMVMESGKVVSAAQSINEVELETGPLANVSKQQLVGIAGAVFAIGLVMMLGSMFMPHSAPTAPTKGAETVKPDPVIVEATPDEATVKAAEIAQKIAGFGTPPPTFKYKDTMKLTEPRESFGLVSEAKNTDLLCIWWPNYGPVSKLGVVTAILPYYNLKRAFAGEDYHGSTAKTAWSSARYIATDANETYVVGTCPSTDPARCIVFIAKGTSNKTAMADPSFPSRLIEEMLAQKASEPAKGNSATKGTEPAQATATADPQAPVALATEKQLADYRKALATVIKSNYKMPQSENADTTVGMSFSVDADGEVSNLQIKPNFDEAFNKAIQKAVDSSRPFPALPPVKGGKYSIKVSADGPDITVEEN